jgi:O-antigen ligase
MKNYESAESVALLDLLGPISLGAYIFSIPTVVLNTTIESSAVIHIVRLLALMVFLSNLRGLRSSQFGSPMLWAVLLYVYSAFTASWEYVPGNRPPILTYTEYTAIAFALSLVVTERTQLLTVMGALAASAICVAYFNHGMIRQSAQALSEAAQVGKDIAAARAGGVHFGGRSAFFGDQNDLGMYAAVAVVGAVSLYYSTGRLSLLVLSGLSTLSAAYLAFFTGSRTAMLAFAIVLVFVLWLALKQRKAIGPLAVVAALALVGGGAAWMYNNPFLSRFDTQEASFVLRAQLLQIAWQTWLQDPVLGLGYEGFVRVGVMNLGTHCTPLEVLCNGGLIGFGLYAAFWWGVCRSLRAVLGARQEAKERVMLHCIALYLVVLALFSLVNFMYQNPLYLVLNGCVCGYLRGSELRLKGQRQPYWGGRAETAWGSAEAALRLGPSTHRIRGYFRGKVLQLRGMRPLYSVKRAQRALGRARSGFGPRPPTQPLRGMAARRASVLAGRAAKERRHGSLFSSN